MLLSTLCVLALLQPAAAPTFPWERHELRLDNGLRVVVVPTDKSGAFAMYEVVGTGSRDEVEPGRSGFAHFFEHMMFRGTKQFPADARTALLAKLGVDEGGYTTDDFTAYHLQGPSAALPELFALEADRYMHLEYSEDDFKTESRAVLGEYNKNFANPDQKAFEVLSNLAFDTHTYKHTTMGFLKDIQAMPEAFAYSRSFFDRFYRPDNVMIIVAGDVDVAAVHARAKETFGAWQGKRAETALKDEPPLTKERRVLETWANPTQPRLHIGWRVPSSTADAKNAALALLVQHYMFSDSSDLVKGLVLGDPTTDQGTPLAEKVSCWWDFHKDASLFPVAVRWKEGAATDAGLARVQGHLDAVAAGRINDRRFADVKSHLRYALLMGLTSPDKIAGTLAWLSGPSMDVGAVDAVYAALQTTTPKDLQAFVKKHFGASQRAIVELRHQPTPAAGSST
jgi:zinc protease